MEGNFEWMRRHPAHATIYLLMYYLARLDPKYKQVHSAIRQAGADRITAILEKRKTGRPSKALAKAIQAVITGALVDAMTTAAKGGLEQRLAETQQAVSALIQGSK